MTTLLPDLSLRGQEGPDTAVLPLWSTFATHRTRYFAPAPAPASTPVRFLTYILFGSIGSVSGKVGGQRVTVSALVANRRSRVRMVAWSSAWLFVLGAPAAEIWEGHDHPAALAVATLVGFVALYLTLWWVVVDRESSMRMRLSLLGGLTGLALVGSMGFHGSWPFLFFFVSVSVASAFPRKLAFFAILVVTGLDALVMVRPEQRPINGREIFGVLIAGLVVLFIMRMLQLIRELNAAREEVARLAVADERVRFARDLHDLLGHTLSLIVVKSEAVRRLVSVDAEAAARESGDIETVSRQALAEVREAVTNYRDRSLDVELAGARAALSAAGIEATVNVIPDRLPESVENVLGWTVREGVTNVVRHSNGRHCAIDVRQDDGVAVLEICDDGDASGTSRELFRDIARAAAPAPVCSERQVEPNPAPSSDSDGTSRAGSGLRGLAERLAQAHGRLEAGRRSDGSFRLAVTVPLNPDGRDAV